MSHVQVEVWDSTLTTMYSVIKPLSASFRDARGETGSGQLEVDYDARYGGGSSKIRDRLLAKDTVIRHVYIPDAGASVPLFAWMVEEVSVPALITEGATIRVSGRGILCWLERGIIYPPRGLRRRSLRDRQFGFGAHDVYANGMGSTFTAPQMSVHTDIPPDWPTASLTAIWPTNPESGTPVSQEAWFYRGITLATGGRHRIDATGDDLVQVWIDGEKVIDQDGRDIYGPGENRSTTWRGILSAGDHWLMLKGRQIDLDDLEDLGLTAANTGPAWVAVRLASIVDDDDLGTEIIDGADFALSTLQPPGWNAGFSLRLMLSEAANRIPAVSIPLTWGFSNDADSNGVDLPHVVNRSWPVTTDLLRFAQDLTEFGVDIWTGPDKVLRMAVTRGVDRTGEGGIRLYPAHNLSDYRVVIRQKVRTVAVVNTADGFIETQDTDAVALYGRVETGLDLATTDSIVQAQAQALTVLQPLAWPQRETDGDRTNLIPFKGAVPAVDFGLADLIQVPDGEGGYTSAQVQAYAWALDGDRDQWSAELDLAQKGARRASQSSQQKVLTIAQSGGAASAGGNVRSAAKR